MAEAELKVVAGIDGERHLRRARRRINEITLAAKALHRQVTFTSRGYSKSLLNAIDRTDGRWKKHFDDMDKIIQKFGAFTMGGLKLALKAAGAEMLLMAASMVTLHGLFAIGQGLMKAWTGTLNMLGGAASSAAVAIAAVSAAMREQAAAMFAFRGSGMAGYSAFGNNVNKVRVVMRGLHTDSTLAAAGIENLNAAYTAVSQNSTFSRSSQVMLKGLMDFASAGQDVNKGMQGAGTLIGTIQDPRKSWQDIRAAADAMGPVMKETMRKATLSKSEGGLGLNNAKDLIAAINSGQLAALGEVSGQWDAVSGTLISRFKAAFTEIRNDFADLGQIVLGPLKDQLASVTDTFRTGMTRVWGPMVEFAKGPFIEGIGGMVEGITNMFVSLVRRGPEIEGVMGRISDRWAGFVEGWNNVLDRLRPFIDGARVIESAFGNMWAEISQYFRESFGVFNEFLVNNKPLVDDFGTKLGQLFRAFGDFQVEMKELMTRALPYINRMIEGVTSIIRGMTGIMRFLKGIVGNMGDGAGAYGLLAASMTILGKLRSWAGGFLFQKSTGTMNVNAGTVNVGGAAGITKGLVDSGQREASAAAAGMRSSRGLRSATSGGPGSTPETGGQMHLPGMGTDDWQMNPGATGTQMQFPGMGPIQKEDTATAATTARAKAAARTSGQGFTPGASTTPAPRTTSQKWKAIRNRPPGGPSLYQRTRLATALRERAASWEGMRTRFNQSTGAKMGVGAGLGMLAQYAPESMQGSMALGGAAAFINPQIGLGIAGIGGALTAESAGAAGLSGMAGGAAMGARYGVAGAVAGAVIGGITGVLMGAMREEAAKKKYAKDAGKMIAASIIGTYFSDEHLRKARTMGAGALTVDELRKGMSTGKGDKLTELLYARDALQQRRNPVNLNAPTMSGGQGDGTFNGETTDQTLDRMLREAGQGGILGAITPHKTAAEFEAEQEAAFARADADIVDFLRVHAEDLGLGELDISKIEDPAYMGIMTDQAMKSLTTSSQAMDFVMAQGQYNITQLADMMGMTTDEVLELSVATGTNLYDATKNWGEIVQSVTAGLLNSYNDLRNAVADQIGTQLAGLQVGIDRAKAPEIMDEAGRTIVDMVASDDFDAATAGEALQTIYRGAISMAGGDELMAQRGMEQVMGIGGTGWMEGGALGGPEAFQQMMANPEIAAFIRGLSGSAASQLAMTAEVVFANLAGSGRTGVKLRQVEAMLAGGGTEQIDKLKDLGLLDAGTYEGKNAAQLGALFEEAGIETGSLDLTKREHDVARGYTEGSETFKAAVEMFAENIGILVQGAGRAPADTTNDYNRDQSLDFDNAEERSLVSLTGVA